MITCQDLVVRDLLNLDNRWDRTDEKPFSNRKDAEDIMMIRFPQSRLEDKRVWTCTWHTN